MNIACSPFAQPVRRPAAHQYLAARVIDQAFRDARNPNGAPTDSASARAFLSGSPMLSYWCEIAELDLSCVIDRARTLMDGCDAGRRGPHDDQISAPPPCEAPERTRSPRSLPAWTRSDQQSDALARACPENQLSG